MILLHLYPRIHLVLYLFSIATLSTSSARRQPWSFPNVLRQRSIQRLRCGVNDSTTTHDNSSKIKLKEANHFNLSSTNISTASTLTAATNVESEYVVVCVLGIDGTGSTNSSDTGCILVEMIPSDPSIITCQQQQHLRYRYYPNIFQKYSTSSDALWYGVGLLSDVVIIHMHSSADDDITKNKDDELIYQLAMGLHQRQCANLSPSVIYIVVSDDSTTTSGDRAQRVRINLQNATSTDMVQRIEIIHGYKSDSNNNAIADVVIPSPNAHGTQTLTDCTSFIYVLKEAFLRLEYNSSDPDSVLHSYMDVDDNDVVLFDSITSTMGPNVNEFITSVRPKESGGNEVDHPPLKIPKLSFGIVLPFPYIALKRLLKTMVLLTTRSAKKSETQKVNELNEDDLMWQIDRIHEQLRDVQSQQDDYVLSSMDGQNIVGFDLVTLMNPIIEELHTIFVLNEQYMASDSLSILGPINELIIAIYNYQCNTILRNYYGTMYETVFEHQQPQTLTTKWIHSLQERMKDQYRRDIRQLLRPLERHDNVLMTFSKIQQQQPSKSLDIDTFVSNLASDLQEITELRIDVTDMDHGNIMNDLIHPQQYRNRLRRERFYQFSKNILKRAVMIGINYIQGYIAIQSIKHIALQQEREMPKFPLF